MANNSQSNIDLKATHVLHLAMTVQSTSEHAQQNKQTIINEHQAGIRKETYILN